MSHPITVCGIIGCGNIARAYVRGLRQFPHLHLQACADVDMARAQALAAEFALPQAVTPEALLADPAVQIVINLTVPQAHAAVAQAALAAGKHVYGEKPLALHLAEAQAMVAMAQAQGLRLGCAPDTVLGGGVQTARHYLDAGLIGTVIGGSAFMLCGGHESWHPAPAFYYQRGGGPLLDMGPYYLHALMTLLGPVRRVTGVTSRAQATRTITSQPLQGTVVPVEVPTHVVAILEFVAGPLITLTVSFDVGGGHTMPPIELYGTEGSLQVPDPNTFGGPVRISRRDLHGWTDYQLTHAYREPLRGLGVADLAASLTHGYAHRANDQVALHAMEVMEAIITAGEEHRVVELTTTCSRPAPMRQHAMPMSVASLLPAEVR